MAASIKTFEDLIVYQKSFKLAAIVHRLSLTLPKIEQFALADQLRRASRSIPANIAEGFAKKILSVPEFRRFLSMAYGSAEEMRVWLSLSLELGYLDKDKANELSTEYVQIAKMLFTLIRNWQEKK